MSRLIEEAASTVEQAADTAGFARLEVGGCSGLDLGQYNSALDEVLAGLAGPAAEARQAAVHLRLLAGLLGSAERVYGGTEHSLTHMFTSSLLNLPKAFLKSEVTLLTTANPFDAVEQFFTADPDLVDMYGLLWGSGNLARAAAGAMSDGHPVVTDENTDVRPVAVNAPRGVTDLIDELSLRNEGASGEISVSFVFGGDGVRRAIVDIPGTKSWSPMPSPDVTSLATNTRAINGAPTTYEHGVLEAMQQAGVTADEPVMLVGHSQGGMIAVEAAQAALASGRFHVTHVVTAGAPIGRTVGHLPGSVSVLALEGRHDVVPHLDSASNPDRRNVTTVTGGKDYGTFRANHGLDTEYQPLARAVDASHNESIRAFLSGAHGFLDQTYMTTERYVITREY